MIARQSAASKRGSERCVIFGVSDREDWNGMGVGDVLLVAQAFQPVLWGWSKPVQKVDFPTAAEDAINRAGAGG